LIYSKIPHRSIELLPNDWEATNHDAVKWLAGADSALLLFSKFGDKRLLVNFLAGQCGQRFAADLPACRYREVRHPAGEVAAQFRIGWHRTVRSVHDNGGEFLAEIGVRQSDRGDFDDVGMAGQCCLG
jgi:hypothetical protein